MNGPEALLAVVVIGIDHNERRVHHLFGGQHRLAGAPGLGPPLGEGPRDVVQVLEGVVHRHPMGGADGGNPVADDLPEFRFDVPADYKDHVAEPGLDGVMNRVIHDDMAGGVHRFQLLDAAPKAGADAGSHNEQCRFHRIFPSVVCS